MATLAQRKQKAEQQRDRRAKIALAVLGLVLLAVVGFEVPHFLKHKASGGGTAAPAASTAGGTTEVGGVTTAPGVSAAQLQLAAQPQQDQLTRFTRFSGKDPFRAPALPTGSSGGGATVATTGTTTTTSSAPAGGSSGGSSTPTTTATTPSTFTVSTPKPAAPQGPLVPAATITLNGRRGTYFVGTAFPLKKPLFRIAAVGRNVVWISLEQGTFAGGAPLLKITRGHAAKLVDGKDQYVIGLVQVTARHLRAPTAKTSTTTTTSTSTGTTTTTGVTTTVTTKTSP